MFQSARLKLTAWYLLIIMLISLIFSLVIYRGVVLELERGLRRSELRMRAGELGINLPQPLPHGLSRFGPELGDLKPRPTLIADLQEAKKRVRLLLSLVNGGILLVSATAGYFLAGRTLRPIEQALVEQKRFVADASHELRTPLTALKSAIEVTLRDKKLALSGAKKVLKDNLEEVNDLQALTEDLLTLTRFQKGNNHFVFAPVELAVVLATAYRKVKPLAERKGLRVKFLEGSLSLVAHRLSLEKLLTVLLDNAVKYTPAGGRVTVACQQEKNQLLIEVKDTGAGIAPRDLPYIFDRFFRADLARSRDEVSGFGLGLSIAKQIVEKHRGSISVASVLGQGTTFVVRLPVS